MKQEDKPIIQVSHLGKRYGKTVALHDVSFNVKRGELFGIIGPDGSGKTTLFRLLTTLLAADEGQAELCGFNVLTDYRKIRQRIGYMPGLVLFNSVEAASALKPLFPPSSLLHHKACKSVLFTAQRTRSRK